MNEEDKKILDFIIENYHLDKSFDVDSSLVGSGIIDSMGIVEIVNFLERDLGVKIPDADITVENFETVRSISSYVRSKKS